MPALPLVAHSRRRSVWLWIAAVGGAAHRLPAVPDQGLRDRRSRPDLSAGARHGAIADDASAASLLIGEIPGGAGDRRHHAAQRRNAADVDAWRQRPDRRASRRRLCVRHLAVRRRLHADRRQSARGSADAATSYAAWLFVADAIADRRCCCPRARSRHRRRRCCRNGAPGWSPALLAAGAYWIAMWAMTRAPIASVAALRETSILFAMAISVAALGESVTGWRLAAAILIVGRHRCAEAWLTGSAPSIVRPARGLLPERHLCRHQVERQNAVDRSRQVGESSPIP